MCEEGASLERFLALEVAPAAQKVRTHNSYIHLLVQDMVSRRAIFVLLDGTVKSLQNRRRWLVLCQSSCVSVISAACGLRGDHQS